MDGLFPAITKWSRQKSYLNCNSATNAGLPSGTGATNADIDEKTVKGPPPWTFPRAVCKCIGNFTKGLAAFDKM